MSTLPRTRSTTPPGTPTPGGGRASSRFIDLDAIETVFDGRVDDGVRAQARAGWEQLIGGRRPQWWIVDATTASEWTDGDRATCLEAIRRFVAGGGKRILFVATLPELRALARRVRHAAGAPIDFFTSRAAADARLATLRRQS